MFDIDFFKKINDEYGHPGGDKVLIEISKVALDCFRTADVIARYGGEEFVVILPETDKVGAINSAKRFKKIIEDTGAQIDIEDDGRIFIASVDGLMGEKALKIIETITQDVEVGRIYSGKVVKTTDFGAFVEIIPGVLDLPGKEGMVHISQLSSKRVEKVTDVVKEGDQIIVKAIGIDNQGRVKLSRKEALREQAKENN